MIKKTESSYIRSFVRRQGRMTDAQREALATLWPKYGLDAEGQWSWSDIFDHQTDIVLEIGFGNGESLISQAEQNPEQGFVGIEVHGPGIGHCMNLAEDNQLTNIRICKEDAVLVLKNQIPDASLARIQIYFPDPWPKARHHKRRLIQPPLVDLLVQKLQPNGMIHMATDWQPYAEEALTIFNDHPALINAAEDDGFVPKPDWRPITKFERRGHRLGHDSYDLLFTLAE